MDGGAPCAGSLGLARATNARDLGGLPAAGGRRVRRGVLFRANALSRLTDADIAVLDGLGIACLIDFRHPREIEIVGPDRLPANRPTRSVALPLFDPEHDLFTTVSAVLTGRAEPASVATLSDGGASAAMLELYRWLVTAGMAREAFATAMRLIADATALPLLFHCTAGKDRTGWLSALVLGTLGVDRAHIIEDYLCTNELNAAGVARVLTRAAGRFADPSVLMPLLEARPEYLEEAFAEVERAYGGLDGYLRTGLGLDAAVLDGIRANMLG